VVRRGAVGLIVAAVAAVVLAGCSQQQGLALARQACVYVDRSIKLYDAATHETDPAKAASERSNALTQLRLAPPLAAQANSDDGSWDDLMTAISESSRVEEGHLIVSLRASCIDAENGTPGVPVSPGG